MNFRQAGSYYRSNLVSSSVESCRHAVLGTNRSVDSVSLRISNRDAKLSSILSVGGIECGYLKRILGHELSGDLWAPAVSPEGLRLVGSSVRTCGSTGAFPKFEGRRIRFREGGEDRNNTDPMSESDRTVLLPLPQCSVHLSACAVGSKGGGEGEKASLKLSLNVRKLSNRLSRIADPGPKQKEATKRLADQTQSLGCC